VRPFRHRRAIRQIAITSVTISRVRLGSTTPPSIR
jgi:hypothetical protein